MNFLLSGFYTGWVVEQLFRSAAEDSHEFLDVLAPDQAKYAFGRLWMGPSGTMYGHTLTDHDGMAGLVRVHLSDRIDLEVDARLVRLHVERDQISVDAVLPITEQQRSTLERIAHIHRPTPFCYCLSDIEGRRRSSRVTGIEGFRAQVETVRWAAPSAVSFWPREGLRYGDRGRGRTAL